MFKMEKIAIEGPFGNPETQISNTQKLNLRKNVMLEEARDVCMDVMDGKQIIHIAQDAENLMGYSIGLMIAKMADRSIISNVDLAFEALDTVFTRENLAGKNAIRFNRRTVFNLLREFKIVREGVSIRDAKPAGTLPTISEIARIIENHYAISLEQIQSPARSRPIVQSRFIAIWVMRYVCGHSLSYIGDQLGKRDHTSILNGVNRIRQIRGADGVTSNDAAERQRIDNICDEADYLALLRHHSILKSQSGIRRVH